MSSDAPTTTNNRESASASTRVPPSACFNSYDDTGRLLNPLHNCINYPNCPFCLNIREPAAEDRAALKSAAPWPASGRFVFYGITSRIRESASASTHVPPSDRPKMPPHVLAAIHNHKLINRKSAPASTYVSSIIRRFELRALQLSNSFINHSDPYDRTA